MNRFLNLKWRKGKIFMKLHLVFNFKLIGKTGNSLTVDPNLTGRIDWYNISEILISENGKKALWP